MKSSRFVFWSIALLALWSAVMLTGCGGGNGSSSPSGTSGLTLSGRAVVPAGTTVRSVTTDIALPAATVKVFDITTAGLAALTGTPAGTTTTDSNGNYTAPGIVAGHNYMVVFSKTVTVSGVAKTLSLGVFVTIPTGTTTKVTADADTSTTVGLNYLVQLLTNNPSALTLDLTSVFKSFVQAFDTKRNNGTAPAIDLSKSCADPASYPSATQGVVQDTLTTGTYLNVTPSSSKGIVDLMYSKDMGKMKAALFVLDSAGAYYDADSFSLDVDASGNFTGTSDAGLYTIKGLLINGTAIGTWKAVPSSTLAGGTTTETAVAFHSALATPGTYRSVGYLGNYTPKSQTGPQGQWLFFVDAQGNALMLASDNTKPSLSHLLTTTVISGTVSTSGAITGAMVFPVVTGSVTGSDPGQGGTATGSSSGGSTGGHSASGSSTVTGTLSGSTVSGTWAASGLKDGSSFNTSGTWAGTRL